MKKYLYLLMLFWSNWANAQTKGFTPKNTTVPEGTERRFALVIGNKDYTDISPLQNPINDANDVSVALQKIGFEVVTLTNADQRKMGTTFRDFLQKLLPSDVALVYYSGHGISYNGKNYLIPTDATIKCLQDVEDYKTLESMVVSLESRGVRNTFIFLDACRNLPNLKPCMSETKDVVISKGLIRPSHNPTGSMIVFATGEGETADDNSKDRNGLFTSEFLKHLTTPNIGLRQIIDRTKKGVERASNHRQSPARYDNLSDEFVFVITEDKAQNTNEISQKQLEAMEKERMENEALKKEIARLKDEKEKVVKTQPKTEVVPTRRDPVVVNAELTSFEIDLIEKKKSMPSPLAILNTTVANSNIKIIYSQPSLKGRNVWSETFAPFGKVWRTGANECTTFETSKDILVSGQRLPAGKYSFFTVPNDKEWTIIFNKTLKQWGAYSYKEENDFLRIKVPSYKSNSQTEKFTISQENNLIVLAWDYTRVSFDIK